MSTSDLVRRARELARLREKATKGPWRVVPRNEPYGLPPLDYEGVVYAIHAPEEAGGTEPLFTWLEDWDADVTFGFRSEHDAVLAASSWEMAEVLEKLVEAFQDELTEYGQHKPTCPRARASGDTYFRVACTCGFDALRGMSPDPRDET